MAETSALQRNINTSRVEHGAVCDAQPGHGIHADTDEPFVSAIEAAGFEDVKLAAPDAVEQTERASQPERERWSPRYLVIARRLA